MNCTLWALVMSACVTVRGQPLTPVPFESVAFTGGFWAQRLAVVRDATLKANFHQCDITGRLDNLAIAAGEKPGVYKGYFFNDSDVYKAIEGAAYVLATMPAGPDRAALDQRLDDLIATIAAAQQPDGYINSYFQTKDGNPAIKDTDSKWSNTRDKHEMYCMGHLIEAGVAHFGATGKRSLLDVAIKAADHIDATFGPAPRRPDVCGHEEIELALIRLWRLSRESKAVAIPDPDRYLRLAEHFITTRGVPAQGRALYGEYCQDHAPLADQAEVVGHAVRAMYLCSAATDLALISARTDAAASTPLLTDHRSLITPLEALWTDLTARKMYVTGGIGNSGHNEGFTKPYDLPNDTAYAETCATIGLAMWAHRMNLLTRDARYFDLLETALYNGILSGLSLDGSKFFYENPLGSSGDRHRKDWYACACCPPNILRFLASMGGLMYAVDTASDPPAIYVNFYGASTATISVGDGTVKLIQETRYPWVGKVRLIVEPSYPKMQFTLHVRIPGWCDVSKGSTSNGATVGDDKWGNIGPAYKPVYGPWRQRSTVDIEFPMPVRRVYSHPRLITNQGRVALQRGPVVYCLEDSDNRSADVDAKQVTNGVKSFERRPGRGYARDLAIQPHAAIEARYKDDLLGGVTILAGEARRLGPPWNEEVLYRSHLGDRPVIFTAIPYFAWANREPGGMQVWIPESAAAGIAEVNR